MSGDVQPRKRKEKRRKREDEDSGTPPPQLVNPAEHAMDNVTIHVYKEGSTGGHWCAKIIFFTLFTALIGLVGVIILEHRGTTDVDTTLSSSKWAVIFEGWVDDILPSHDDEHHDEESSKEDDEHDEDEHDHNEEEEEEHDDDEEHDKESHEEDPEEDEDEGVGSEDLEDDEDEEEEEEDNDEVEEFEAINMQGDDDDDDDEEENSEDIEDDDEEGEDDDDDNDDEVDQEEEEEENDESEADASKAENDDDEGFEDDDDDGINLDESNENASAEEDDKDEVDSSKEEVQLPSKEDEDDYEFTGMPGIDERGDFEKMEIVEGIEVPKDKEDEVEDETNVPVKFGVGVALVIAAHIVLSRRWKNADASSAEEIIDLKRRNTTVPFANPKKLIATSESSQQQRQTKTYQDIKSKYRNLQEDTKRINKPLSSKEEETSLLKATKEPQEIHTSESERYSGTELESDYMDDDLEPEVEDVEDEEDLEDEEEVEDVDDRDLVAKLEAKYGKLPTPSQSEEEEDEEDEEEDEEIEDEEEEYEDEADWKRINIPKSKNSAEEDKKLKESESARGRQVNPPPRGGRQVFDSEDYENVNIQDEIEHWLAKDLDN